MEEEHKGLEELKNILEKNIDAGKGFGKAAELAEKDALKNFFRKRAKERKEFAEDLQRELRNHYSFKEENGSLTGTIHRTWMDVKSFFSGNADEAMLEEALKAERKSLEEYEHVLNENSFPMAIGALLRDQKMRIQVDLNKIESLADLE